MLLDLRVLANLDKAYDIYLESNLVVQTGLPILFHILQSDAIVRPATRNGMMDSLMIIIEAYTMKINMFQVVHVIEDNATSY